MPELPEVESVRVGVHEWTAGATITDVEVLDSRILGTTSARSIDPAAVDGFTTAVAGRRIIGAERRGKFMWLSLGQEGGLPDEPSPPPELSLLIHLGMSGQLRIHRADDPIHRHTRAILRLGRGSDVPEGSGPTELRFVDQRIFGHLGVQPLVHAFGRLVPASANHIAADPLEPEFEPGLTITALSQKRTAIKSALLDQTLVSGIGNIYADEALFRAGVHPLANPARTLKSRLAAVLESATAVMSDALAVGGTSFDSLYVNVNGESGYFDRALLVYGRGGQECVRCGTEIQRLTVGGRSSHYCPVCQKPPRYR
ncbi:bifunctional DNA-formamidopyrimidine glycosylase/DNA-(apurinic or apyrimidinic site) lyase [Brevibacterium renqingii]|uniref:bifunctional DNA-formamidopyrimidine glycosylase/DNA-(apurinic or apyrimidinic site) lyase n=1 Tax=Brevibacterium renqingii TaxID=2776916 RepID=UPI001ADF0750|nr:bifunctional DNA-formamidopyrimidine glycosylase/DNA-(apurinic or apyrimidinic site) lyase [Brevibacterium renqingii]